MKYFCFHSNVKKLTLRRNSVGKQDNFSYKNRKVDEENIHEKVSAKMGIVIGSRTTISQDVQTRFSVQLAFAKFLSKIKEIF